MEKIEPLKIKDAHSDDHREVREKINELVNAVNAKKSKESNK